MRLGVRRHVTTPRCSKQIFAKPTRKRLICASIMAKACRFEFENDRGLKLHGVEYLPDSRQQWATLIWHHGVCEHKERYCAGELLLLCWVGA